MGSAVADDAGAKTEPENVPDKAAAGQKVMLRVEVASKGQARLITYSVILLNLVFIVLSIGLLAGEGAFGTLGDFRPLYRAQLVLASICLGVLLVMLLRLGLSFRRSKVERRVWSKRQTYFFRTAAVLATLVTCYTTFYVAALADTLAQPNCGYPWMPLAALEFLRRFSFSAIILFLLVRVHNMKLWRGPGALDMDPNYRLLVDRPFRDKARSHIIVLVIWAVMVAMAALSLYSRVAQYNRGARDQFGVGCSLEVDALVCKSTAVSKAAAIVSFVAMLAFQLVWVLMLRRALLDHKQLPYCRYKDTSIFIRIQARIVGPVLVAVLLTMLTLELVPALRGNCMGPVTAQMGNLPLQLSLTLASTIIAVLYTPVPSDAHSPLQNELLQQFAWTAAELPRVLEQRTARLAAAEAATKLGEQDDSLLAQLENVHAQLADQLGRLTHAQGGASAAEQLRAEPVFCLETALRLFYWARLAYRNEEKLDYKWVNEAGGRALFGLDHAEALWDEDTDTHAVLGWSASAAVVAFRGTSSLQNTMTDLKSWRVPLVPRRRHEGRLVTVHAGFQKAWLHNDFNKKVLAKLAEISKAASKPLRIWVTGHSLGGALAVLASLEIHEQHPDSQMTTVTFGCPRVGNAAYAAAYDAAVPDTWSVVNGTDPVAWIPKVGFKRVGKRVNIDGLGNMLVRPSYFELSVVQRGTNPKHHMTGAYALSMASIVKNQFSPTRSIPGGDGGAAELAGSLDLGSVLVLTRMDLEALRDPSLPPQSSEKLEREALEAARKPSGAVAVECGCGGRWRRRRQATPLVADEAETEVQEKGEPEKAEL